MLSHQPKLVVNQYLGLLFLTVIPCSSTLTIERLVPPSAMPKGFVALKIVESATLLHARQVCEI